MAKLNRTHAADLHGVTAPGVRRDGRAGGRRRAHASHDPAPATAARRVGGGRHGRDHRLRLSQRARQRASDRARHRRVAGPGRGPAARRRGGATPRRVAGGGQRRLRRLPGADLESAGDPDVAAPGRPAGRPGRSGRRGACGGRAGSHRPPADPRARPLHERPAVASRGARPRRSAGRRARLHAALPALQQRPACRRQRPRSSPNGWSASSPRGRVRSRT